MKLTIKSNGKINTVHVDHRSTPAVIGDVDGIEVDFEPATLFSDFEIWLEDDKGKVIDYARMNLTKRNKMKFDKG